VQYLNTRLRGKAAEDLARQLSVLLDQRLPAKLNEISDKPEGSLSDTLTPDRDVIGTITGDEGRLDIELERVKRGEAGEVWLFSGKTLESVPDWYEEADEPTVDSFLPQFLVTHRIANVPLFEWLALLVGLPLLYALATLLSWMVRRLIARVQHRSVNKKDGPKALILPGPVRLLFIAITIRWLLTKVSLPLLARQFWSSAWAVMAIAAVVWILILLSGYAERFVSRRLRKYNLTGTASVLRLTRRIIDVLLIFAGLVAVLYHFGVSPTAALAGLGVGGIAVALAAQKTLENVVGGISLIFDQAVRVGDFLKVGDTVGEVDEIGLRSIRIRTFDRTIVNIPNGQIAAMSIETLSARDKYWFHPPIALRSGTTGAQIHSVIDNLRMVLSHHPSVDSDSVRVRFLGFGTSSFNVDVFAYLQARDWIHFLEIQEGLLFSIVEIVEQSGSQLALPSQATILVDGSGLAAGNGTRLGAVASAQ
jgi:MscS family membrane protein